MFSTKNYLCNCNMDSFFSVKTLDNPVISVKDAMFSVKNAVKLTEFVMAFYKMSLQNAMSELIKLVDKITDGDARQG